MVRTYKKKIGTGYEDYKDTAKEKMENAMSSVRSGEMNISEAAQVYNVRRTTLSDKLRNLHPHPSGHPTVYSAEEENGFVDTLVKCSEMGFPMGIRDLKYLVQAYNSKCGKKIAAFDQNMPGDDWIRGFLSRHPELTQRFANNIKRARAEVDRKTLEDYFKNLAVSIKNLSPNQIFNYDETNFSDDPGRKTLLAKRGMKYVDRVMNSTKSVMFCGSADGIILPPYVCYKGVNMWSNWKIGGPVGAPFCECRSCKRGCGYNQTAHGWFDARVFFDWFRDCFMPHAKRIPGKKALIGDNLSSHFSEDVIKMAEENEILFICLPPNSTHLTQPLDVAFFRPVKIAWRHTLVEYKQRTKTATLEKPQFPRLLRVTFESEKLKPKAQHNLRSGFEATGICPLDGNRVLMKVPATANSSGNSSVLSDAVMDLLSDMRYGSKEKPTRGRGKKMTVPAGKSHTQWERESHSDSGDDGHQSEGGEASGEEEQQPGPSVASLSARLGYHRQFTDQPRR